jgi:hypothetical protein
MLKDSQSIISKNLVTLKSVYQGTVDPLPKALFTVMVNNKIMTILKQSERKIFSLNQILLIEENEQY